MKRSYFHPDKLHRCLKQVCCTYTWYMYMYIPVFIWYLANSYGRQENSGFYTNFFCTTYKRGTSFSIHCGLFVYVYMYMYSLYTYMNGHTYM